MLDNIYTNMGNREINIRFIISFVFLVIGLIYSFWLLVVLSFAVAYTAFTKSCLIYKILGINKELSLRNFYISNLPKYNPDPVFIVNKDAKVIFKNAQAEELFPKIDDFCFLIDDYAKIESTINEDDFFKKEYNFTDKSYYLFTIKGVKKLDALMIYGTNITETVEANKEIFATQREIVYAMGEIGEMRSKETGHHVKRVAEFSHLLALEYGLSEKDAAFLKMASPMHDIGKVAIPDNILKKPGKLTKDEFEIMKTHAELGFNMLKNSSKHILEAAAIVAYEHHEKWDGSGYPRGLKEEEIHVYGRVTAVADVFDALSCDRVYKKAWPMDEVLTLFKEQKGKHFEPRLVDLLLKNIDKMNEIRLSYKD